MKVFLLAILTSLASVSKVDAVFGFIFGRATTTTRPTLKPREAKFAFEGVDYDYLPQDLYEKNNDCYSHFIQCIRGRTIIAPVCAWNSKTWYFEDNYSPCQIDLKNCFHRVKEGFTMFGTLMTNDMYFYNGENYDCTHYTRMGGNMMEAYFGVQNARRNYDYDALRSHPYLIR